MKKQTILVVLSMLGLTACWQTQTPRSFVRPVKLSPAQSLSSYSKDFVGVVSSDQSTNLAFRVGGQVIRTFVGEGDQVREGQVLAKLDPGDFQLQLEADKAQFTTAQSILERSKRLLAKQAISQQDYEIAQSDYLRAKKISLNRLRLDSINVYAFKGKDGVANWDIVASDTAAVDTAASTGPIAGEIDIRRVVVRHATVTYDDRETRVFANLWDANLKLKAHLQQGHSMLALDYNNKNILFWQDGELLAHRIAARLKTEIELDRASRTIGLHDALLDLNGVELDLKGNIRRDTLAKALDIDLQYGLHTPSLETVLHMLPESVVKKEKVSARGDVTMNGIVKGLYGKDKMPMITLKVLIDNASAKYARLPYGIDEFKADFFGQVDFTKTEPSYLDLKIFHFKGAHTDILADARVTDLLDDPDITFHARSTIDLTALAQTFPLQEGVSIEGKVDADLRLHCRLSSVKKKDLGRIKALGKMNMTALALRDKNKGFEFTSDASLRFFGNDMLGAQAQVKNIVLNSPRLNSTIENLSAAIKTG